MKQSWLPHQTPLYSWINRPISVAGAAALALLGRRVRQSISYSLTAVDNLTAAGPGLRCTPLVLLVLVALAGCGSHSHPLPAEQLQSAPVLSPTPESSAPASSRPADSPFIARPAASDQARLARLWQQRTKHSGVADYPIGPGDLLEINVTVVEELKTRSMRVSGEGTITLPFVGVIHASGLTEKQLRGEIYDRLQKYIYDPQIDLFVREYRSRQVAVLGSVEKPGLYSLASGNDTILDMISLAGGIKADAAPRINLVPADPTELPDVSDTPSTVPVQLASNQFRSTNKGIDPIVIDLQNFSKGGNQMYLTLPARPGDVIMIASSGEVLVAGWVEKPASYKITPGLTVLGAVDAAGGTHFAADTSAVKVLRVGKDGEKKTLLVDLEKIRNGNGTDIPVQEGDVIEVSSSTAKLLPYGFYHFVISVFHSGLYF